MTELTKANVGELLQQANVSSYILSMGKSVAEAQAALDANSIAQLPQFTTPLDTLGGKSLIQMGLLPTFYQFTKATLSASLSLSLKVSESFDIGGELTLGGKSNKTKKVDKTSYKSTSLTKEVVLSDTARFESAAWNENGTALEKIHSYSGEQTIEGKTHYVIAERAAVEGAKSLSANSLVTYNAEAAIFAVPPAGKDWQVWSFATETAALNALTSTSAADNCYIWGAVTNTWNNTQKAKWIGAVFFDFNRSVVTADNVKRLRAIAHIAKALGATIALTGHTDRKGQDKYNKDLGEKRAKQVKEALGSHVSGLTFAPIVSKGETMAQIAETADDPTRAPDRRVDIVLSGGSFAANTFYVYLCGAGILTSIPTITDGTPITPGGSGTYDTTGTTSLTSPGAVTEAAAFATTINADTSSAYEASVVGELVYLSNKSGKTEDVFTLSIYDEAGELVTFSQESSAVDTTTATEGDGKIKNVLKDKITTSAFGFSADGRYARSYDMSMSGNMSIGAELVAVPPPQAFLDFVAAQGGE